MEEGRPGRMPQMDSLRALAAFCVVEYHGVGIFGTAVTSGGWFKPILGRFDFGLPVFLLISAFLLYRPFVRAHMRGEQMPSTAAYAWRRFLRIVPPFWVALIVAAIVVPLSYVLTLHGFFTYFGFAQIYSQHTIGLGDSPAWTLGLEASFYAFLPFWAVFMRRLPLRGGERSVMRAELAGISLLVVASLAYKAAMFAAHNVPLYQHPTPELTTLPGYMDELGFGMALAVMSVWIESHPLPRVLRPLDRFPSLAWMVALAAFLTAAYGIGLHSGPPQLYTPREYMTREILYGIIAASVMLPILVGNPHRGRLRRFLANRTLIWLGTISYGVYLWHWTIMLEFSKWQVAFHSPFWQRYLIWGTVPILLAIVFGAMSWYLVERPAMSLRRFVRERRRPVATPAVEPAP